MASRSFIVSSKPAKSRSTTIAGSRIRGAVNGGLPGGRSRKLMVRTDGTKEILSSKCDHVKVNPGDLLHYITWGGGGWGDPLTRDPALVAKEVGRGLVTRAGAKRYGVILNTKGAVDSAATKKAARQHGQEARQGSDLRLRWVDRRTAQGLQEGDGATGT
jgi:N-methylhydantoinase B/oxoprolinase/acetone carboxylase alpha subunit